MQGNSCPYIWKDGVGAKRKGLVAGHPCHLAPSSLHPPRRHNCPTNFNPTCHLSQLHGGSYLACRARRRSFPANFTTAHGLQLTRRNHEHHRGSIHLRRTQVSLSTAMTSIVTDAQQHSSPRTHIHWSATRQQHTTAALSLTSRPMPVANLPAKHEPSNAPLLNHTRPAALPVSLLQRHRAATGPRVPAPRRRCARGLPRLAFVGQQDRSQL
jgi:hypothetical protein